MVIVHIWIHYWLLLGKLILQSKSADPKSSKSHKPKGFLPKPRSCESGMLKHTQVHISKYVACFGILEVEGVDKELLCIGGFVNEAGVEGRESTGGTSVLKSLEKTGFA